MLTILAILRFQNPCAQTADYCIFKQQKTIPAVSVKSISWLDDTPLVSLKFKNISIERTILETRTKIHQT